MELCLGYLLCVYLLLHEDGTQKILRKIKTMESEEVFENISYSPETCVWCGKLMWSLAVDIQGWFCSKQCERCYCLEQDYLEVLAIHEGI